MDKSSKYALNKYVIGWISFKEVKMVENLLGW